MCGGRAPWTYPTGRSRWRCNSSFQCVGQYPARAANKWLAAFSVTIEATYVNWPTQVRVVFARILALAIAFRVVDVLRRQVDTQALRGDFEFVGGIPMCHKSKGHAQVYDRLQITRLETIRYRDVIDKNLQLEFLERGDIDGLAVIA